MAKVKLLLSILLLLLLEVSTPIVSWSQLQRMGIARGTLEIGPKGTNSINAYCMDFDLRAPNKGDIAHYTKILTSPQDAIVTVGNRSMQLQEAIKLKKITIEGLDMTQSRRMEIRRGRMTNGNLSRAERQRLLQILRRWDNMTPVQRNREEVRFRHENRNNIYRGDHTRLNFVNLTDEPVNITFRNNAVLGGASDRLGTLNPDDIVSAVNVIDQIRAQDIIWAKGRQRHLAYLGYYEGEIDGLYGPQSWNATATFLKDRGTEVTDDFGLIDKALRKAVGTEKNKERQQHLAYLGYYEGEIDGLYGPQSWNATATFLKDRGTEVTDDFDLIDRTLKEATQDSERLVLEIYQRRLSPTMYLHQREIKNELLTFQRVGDINNVLFNTTDGIELQISDRGKITGEREGIDAIRYMDLITRSFVADNSDDTIQFLHVSPSTREDAVHVQMGKRSFQVDKSALRSLLSGETNVPEFDHIFSTSLENMGEPTSVIVYRDAFSQAKNEMNVGDDDLNRRIDPLFEPRLLTQALAERYNDKAKFFLDDEMRRGRMNLKNLPGVSTPSDVAAYIAPASFNVTDFETIQNVQVYFNEAGVEVFDDIQKADQSNVIVINGHKDQALRDYVESLGKAGALRGKYVVMFSCYDTLDEPFYSRMTEQYGARAIKNFDVEINSTAVEHVLIEFIGLLNEPLAPQTNLDELIQRSIEISLERNPPEWLKAEIEKLHQSVVQISSAQYRGFEEMPYGRPIKIIDEVFLILPSTP